MITNKQAELWRDIIEGILDKHVTTEQAKGIAAAFTVLKSAGDSGLKNLQKEFEEDDFWASASISASGGPIQVQFDKFAKRIEENLIQRIKWLLKYTFNK